MGEFITYKDGMMYKTLNRRTVIIRENGINHIYLIRTTTPEEREKGLSKSNDVQYYCKRKIKVTRIMLQNEALEALMIAMKFYIQEGYSEQ